MATTADEGDALPPSSQKGDYLKLFWTLAESDRDVRTQAAAQLLAHLKLSPKQDTEVQYTLKRLVRGLASSRDAARQGFSSALSSLLTAFPQLLKLQETHELLREAMEMHSSMKPMEQREHMFGRLFGLLALHRSGRLKTDLPLLVTVVKELLDMAGFKRWFRETCYEAALTLLVDVPVELFLADLAATVHSLLQIQGSKDSNDQGAEAWNADQVLLAVGVQRYLLEQGIEQDTKLVKQLPDDFAARNTLQRHNVHLLARPLRASSGCYPRVHSAWFGVFGHVLHLAEGRSAKLDSELLQETWTVLVENSLVGGANPDESGPTSHERQGLALKLFELVAPKLPASSVQSILTPRFVKCLYTNAVTKKNYLHEAARHCLKSFAACAPAEFFRFFRQQFMSPLSILVTPASADSGEENEKPSKKQKLNAGGFNALIELEEKKEREDTMKRRTDRARVWTVEVMVAALSEMLSAKTESDVETEKLQDDVLRFLVFHSFFTSSGDAGSGSITKGKKNKVSKKTKATEVEQVVHEAAAANPALSENVASYAKTRLFSMLSLGLAGVDGVRAHTSVLSRVFAIAKSMKNDDTVGSLREPLDEEDAAQFRKLVGHVESLWSKEEDEEKKSRKSQKTATRRPLSEAFLLLLMSAGLQLLDGEQREDAVVVVADLEKCFVQLVARKQKSVATKKKNKTKEQNEGDQTEEESIVVLTDLLLSLLSQDSSALREIVSQVFRSLLPLLDGACLTTMVNVLEPSAEAEDDDDDDEEGKGFASNPLGDDEEEDGEEGDEEAELSSADALSDAFRRDEKLASLYREDLAIAAIVGQVKVRSQRKKDLKRARLQTMHFQLRVVDLLQVFVSQRSEQGEATFAKHSALVLSLVAPLFRVLIRVQSAASETEVLRDRVQAVLLHKVLRVKDKIPFGEAAQTEALGALRQIVELIRTSPMDKDHSGKVAAAAVVYLVRVICSHEASNEEEVQTIMRESVFDAFTKKHSRFPRASFEELLLKSPAVGARVLLEPLAAVAAAPEKKKDAEESKVQAAVDEFSKCEVLRLLTVLLRGSSKLQQTKELSTALQHAFKRVQKFLKTAVLRHLAPESVQQLKAKRMKIVMTFALQLVKIWHTSADKKTTEADVRAVVAAVQAVESQSPVVKGLMKRVSEAAGIPFEPTGGGNVHQKVLVKNEDDDDDDVANKVDESEAAVSIKSGKSAATGLKDKHKLKHKTKKTKRKRSSAEK
uniref:DNA polymerase V n=1 Tax=Peronospora matthiolae TaxID=2874970 RepID=A0AAV1UQG7_9STRA